MIRLIMFLAAFGLAAPAFAQQNQMPGDSDAGGNSQVGVSGQTAAHAALSGANTSDATTTGSSGPRKKASGPAGGLGLPPLPSADLCKSYEGDVRAACLSTTTNTAENATGAAQ